MTSHYSTPGFADTWTFADRERGFKARQRDYRSGIVAKYSCEECGAKPGELCTRTAFGKAIPKRYPHIGRSPPIAGHKGSRYKYGAGTE